MTKITNIRPAGRHDQVVTVEGGGGSYRKSPCPGCPWIKANVGAFPAESFRHSANTAFDMSQNQFGCHASGTTKPATCAGFLLRGADHNLAVRMARITGKIADDVTEAGETLFESYRDMAVANGVSVNDPSIARCR